MGPTKSRGERCDDNSTEPQYPSRDAVAERVAPLVPFALSRDAPDDARAIDSVTTSMSAPRSVAAAVDATAVSRGGAGPPDLPRLLTPDEAADLLRTTRKAIYARAARGRLPGAVRDGRRLLVRLDQLLKSLEPVTGSTPGSDPR
jgi:excisionase family DNA binding protein